MVIPDRSALVFFLTKLQGRKYNESTPEEFAKQVLEAVAPMPDSQGNEVASYVREASVDSIINFHGEGAPPAEELTLLKLGLDKLSTALGDRKVPLDPKSLRRLKELLEGLDQYSLESSPAVPRLPASAAIFTPSTAGQLPPRNTPVPLNDPSIAFTPPTISDLRKGLNTPVPAGSSRRDRAKEVLQSTGPQELYNTEQIFASKDATASQEFLYYVFASIALGGVVYLILDAYYQEWQLITRLGLSGAVPVAFMTVYALLRTFNVLQYVRMIFSIMFLSLIVYLGGVYGYKLYESYQANLNTALAQERGEGISRALEAFLRDNGRYPASLSQLVTPVNYLRPSEGQGIELFADPFAPNRQFVYNRFVDGWLLKSTGPQQREIILDWPSRFDREFWERHSAVSYDPTNGARSAGNIIMMPQNIIAKRRAALSAAVDRQDAQQEINQP